MLYLKLKTKKTYYAPFATKKYLKVEAKETSHGWGLKKRLDKLIAKLSQGIHRSCRCMVTNTECLTESEEKFG